MSGRGKGLLQLKATDLDEIITQNDLLKNLAFKNFNNPSRETNWPSILLKSCKYVETLSQEITRQRKRITRLEVKCLKFGGKPN